ncbi:protein phosphatase 2C domain-containing protein [Streptomyces solicamelliae]|uniref:protein phosphatase 2C domain-containing protein n=1 Tax=Streptomyces solicamelliae TaxID=3231716 RepID=UPI0038783055
MTQQGDNWWDKLYDGTAPDTAPTSSGDTLDDRFASATRATGKPGEPGEPGEPGLPDPPADGPPAPPVEQTRPGGEVPPPPTTPPSRRGEGPPLPTALPSGGAEVPRPPTAPPPPSAPPSSGGVDTVTPGAATPACPEPPVCPPPSSPASPPSAPLGRAPWEVPVTGARVPRTFPSRPAQPPVPPEPPVPPAPAPESATAAVPRPRTGHVGDRPPTYEAEPTALPPARPGELAELVADTVLDGARYGACTLRAASVRGDSARYRGEPRRDALLTARFGHDEAALVLVAVAGGVRAAECAHLAAADVCRWIGEAVGRSHARLSEDIRAGRRGDLKSGLHRLTDRTYGRLRNRAAERGVDPEEYTATLRCLLISADPECRTRVFFGIGRGGLFRLRDGAWHDIEPLVPESGALTGAAVVASEARWGSPRPEAGGGPPVAAPEEAPPAEGLTVDLGIVTPPGPFVEDPLPPPAEPFRFRASVARPGDILLLASNGFAEPLRGEPALGTELAARWADREPPGLAAFLADTQMRVKGYADDRTGVAVWEA